MDFHEIQVKCAVEYAYIQDILFEDHLPRCNNMCVRY